MDTLIKSVERLADQKLDLLLPSQGRAIQNPPTQLKTYHKKLTVFRESYVRGYKVFESTEQDRDSFSKPTAVPLISQVTPHLYKLSHKTKGKNFAIIISDNGKGLILDCGLFPKSMLEEIIVKSFKNGVNIRKTNGPWAPQGTHKKKNMFRVCFFKDLRSQDSLWAPISSPFEHSVSVFVLAVSKMCPKQCFIDFGFILRGIVGDMF